MGPAAFGQTIAVVDKSGKVISTSKTLISIFNETKAAYRERKAEVVAARHANQAARKAQRALTYSDDIQSTTSRGTNKTSRSKSRSKSKHQSSHVKHHRSSDPLTTVNEDSATSRSPTGRHHKHGDSPRKSISRSKTAPPNTETLALRPAHPLRANSLPHLDHDDTIDLDLAYGEIPPPLEPVDDAELETLMIKVNYLLEEAHCVQHSVTTMIASLQKNPDALAAVALTLAEISNVAAKMAPGALAAMKGSFPAVVALLASPQFLIAAGLGVGVVVVALGGYKIIKRIKARSAPMAMPGRNDVDVDELQELDPAALPDVNRIEAWRRGIAPDIGVVPVETSVDGEFITPEAAALKKEERRHAKKKTAAAVGGARAFVRAASASKLGVRASGAVSDKGGERERERERKKGKEKKKLQQPPSALRLLFA